MFIAMLLWILRRRLFLMLLYHWDRFKQYWDWAVPKPQIVTLIEQCCGSNRSHYWKVYLVFQYFIRPLCGFDTHTHWRYDCLAQAWKKVVVNGVDSLDEATVTLGLLVAVGSCTTNYEASKSCVFAVYRSHSDALTALGTIENCEWS